MLDKSHGKRNKLNKSKINSTFKDFFSNDFLSRATNSLSISFTYIHRNLSKKTNKYMPNIAAINEIKPTSIRNKAIIQK